MKRRMTEARWIAVLSAIQHGIDERHDREHNATYESVSECERCRDAHEGLTILRHKYYENYLNNN